MSQAQSTYGIGGGQTIQKWIRRLGKAHLLNKVIHIQMTDEPNKIKELEKAKQALESALAQAQLKIIALESTIKVLEEEVEVKSKKNAVTG
jgi:transposase-like protein